MSGTWVVDLGDPRARDRRLAGGKGAGLAALARLGLPTLPGVVVTAAAFRAAGGRAPGRLAGLAAEVARTARRLGGGPFAVRSSALAEDGTAASWAGLLETRLGVPAADLVRAIGRVWRSARSPRARAYGRRPLELAVVIQPLAPARAAGTCFTATPLGARTPLVVVEAVAGLGAPLVGGALTPDRYLLDRATGVLLESRPARQPWRLALPARRSAAGPARGVARRRLVRERLDAAAATAPKVPRAALKRIARLALAAERRLGGPQDVEWVWTDGGVALVQARPLTA